jgi:hypothetical protein
MRRSEGVVEIFKKKKGTEVTLGNGMQIVVRKCIVKWNEGPW